MFFLVTCTMMHSSTDIIDPDAAAKQAKKNLQFNSIDDYDGESTLAQFNQFYSRVVQVLQVCILVTCFTGLACSEPVAPLVIIVIASLANAIVPFLWSEPVCSVKIVPWLRALGSVLVCWTAIVCALHTRIDAYSWATASALYIGWLVIGLVGLAVVYFMYKRHRAEQAQVVEESGLREAINALLGVTGMLTVGDALSGPTVDEASTWRRGKAIEQRIRGAGSLAELCDLVLDLEYAILIERLDHKFLMERLPWIINLRRAQMMPSGTLAELKRAISVLHQGISSTSMVTHVSRNVLALTLRRKCPEEIAWHIFSYLFDASIIEEILRGILKEQTRRYYSVSFKPNSGRFVSSLFNDYSAKLVWCGLIKQPVYDDRTFGGGNHESAPLTSAPVSTSADAGTPEAGVEEIGNDTGTTVRLIDENAKRKQEREDHELALKLAAEDAL
jgi:cbb3-type cytochrome oxidase subunit 3